MAAGRPGAWPRWRAHRFALDDPNDPKPGALTRAPARVLDAGGLAAGGLQAGGLAG